LTFKHHATDVKSRVKSRNNILKSLSGTTWGMEKETILNTYKAIGQSVINYCSPIWAPNLADINWTHLQVAQSEALRVSLGCVNKTPIDHFNTECKIMKVKDHSEMLSRQFLLATQKEDHPNHVDLDGPPPRRITKQTLQTRFGNEIKNMIPEGGVNHQNYKPLLKQIHTECVYKRQNNLSENKVLNARPPPVNEVEKDFPRRTRSMLCQLRSGYSSMLNSFLSAITENNTEDKCPKCNQPSHTTNHLFNCPADPTDLTTESLWNDPLAAATFLGLDTGQPSDDMG